MSPPFYGGDFYADPYPAYRRLRETGRPFYNAAEGSWLVAGYRDVAAALKEPRLSKRIPGESGSPLDASMLFQDPPDHARLRALLSDGFTAPKVAEMERTVETIADRLLRNITDGGRMEFIGEFATPLPAMVICELLGIGAEEYRELAALSHDMVTLTDENGVVTAESMRRIGEANAKLVEFFRHHLRRQESSGCPFHFPKLLRSATIGGAAEDREKIAAAILLLIAGHETTSNLLGNGLWLLIHHPEAWRELRDDAALLDGAIEEMLRFESPVQRGTFRIAAEDLELAGCRIKMGDQVAALIGAANRDPEVFPDPDVFDIRRSPNRHLAFGNGPHFCMGASLARLEARVAFRVLLERFAEVRVTQVADKGGWRAKLRKFFGRENSAGSSHFPSWTASTMVRGLEALPVEFVRSHAQQVTNEDRKSSRRRADAPFVDYYNNLILHPAMRDFYGQAPFFNVGLRDSPDENQATASKRLVELLLSWVTESPLRALDVACGLGATTAALKNRWPHCEVTGINISAQQVAHAKANAPECSFRQMDATSLDFPDDTFDLILCVEAAFHFDSRRDFLHEAFRVLKKGGVLLLADILFHDTPEAEKTTIWPVTKANTVDGMDGYLGVLRDCGFVISEHREGLDPCWRSFCASWSRWATDQQAAGHLDVKSFEDHFGPLAALPATVAGLSRAVSSYPLVCAIKS